MLTDLQIKNFAIIDDLSIRFNDGLTVLSGETGAGKSIIINAVNLLLGNRASAKMIRDGCDTAELSAFFEVPDGSPAAAIMADNGYAPEAGLLIRRVIAANDRHRIYINDQMATMQMLASITANLASISGQHASQGLLREDQHLVLLDRFGGFLPSVEEVTRRYETIVPLSRQLASLRKKQAHQEAEQHLLRHQAGEIAEAGIQPDEDDTLEQERRRLKHAEFLQHTVFSAIEALHGADGAIVEQLGEIRKNLEKAADLDEELSAGLAALNDHLFGLEDVTENLRTYLGRLDGEPGRLEAVEARLDLINRLKRKYGGSIQAIFAKRDAIETELAAIDHLDDDIAKTEAQLQEAHAEMGRRVRDLSAKRREVADTFARAVEAELGSLKMSGTRFGVQFSHMACGQASNPWLCVDGCQLSPTGIDQAAFVIAPNVGESLKPLSSIASGGELSRVVLALKAILAENDAVGTVIFDEVDAGIGGGVAGVVGKKLKTLAQKHQLICITHLPQIACCGDHHYYIEKRVRNGRTTTSIRPMDREARIMEIARMLGGEKITATARKHAQALLSS